MLRLSRMVGAKQRMRVTGEIRILMAILAIGALLRALYLAEIVQAPGFSAPQVDAAYHDYWARALLTGNWAPPPGHSDPLIRTTPYFRPPGYPYFLALVYLLTGASYLGARVFQMGLGVLSALFAFLLGRHWFGSRMGLIFSGLMSTYWGFIYFEGDLLEPALVSALALLLVWNVSLWTHTTTFARSMLTGLLLGLSALVRPNILVFAPVILGWAWWVVKDRRRFVTAALGMILAALFTISPATVRNYAVARDFVPISSNAGINLLLGNNPEARGAMPSRLPGLGVLDTCFDYPRLVRAVEEKVGRALKHSEVSAYFGERAREHIRRHPLDTLKLIWKKALLFWGPKEVGNNRDDERERSHSSILKWIPGSFAWAAALFVLGLLTSVHGRTKGEGAEKLQVIVLVAAFIGAYFVSYLPYFAAGRFRMPAVPFLLFFGAVGLDRLIQLARERNLKGLAPWLLLLIAAYALTSRNMAGYEQSPFKWHFDRGVDLARIGKADEAIREYQAALEIQPHEASALFNLGSVLEFKGEVDEAMGFYQRALQVNPADHRSHGAMAKILARRGNLAQAAEHYRSALHVEQSPALYVDYAGVLLREKQDDEAMRAYQSALRLDPQHVPAHNNLAILLFLRGDYAGAWMEVRLCRSYGGQPPAHFLKALEEKMPEPFGARIPAGK